MATGTSAFITATTAAAFIPVLWSKEAIVARQKNLVFAERVNRSFEAELAYGSTLHVPSVGNLSTQSKGTSDTSATVFEALTETNTDVTVNQWEYSAIAIETFTKQQVPRDLIATYAPKQGYTLALSIDTALAAYASGLTNGVGSLTSEVTYEDMLRAIQYLDDANVPLEDRVVGISPAQRAGFMKLDQFVHADYDKINSKTNVTAGDRANLGSWMNIPVQMTTNVLGSNAAGHNNMVWQREAIALVLQLDTTVHTFFDVNFLTFKAVAEHIYGSAKMRDDHAVNLIGA